MKILIIDIYPKKKFRIIKDTNGQYGTANDFGDNFFSKFLKFYSKRNLFWPPIYVPYVMSVLKKQNHTVDYSTEYIKGFDIYIFTSSIVSHETEIEVIKDLSNKGEKIISIGPYASNNSNEYISAGSKVVSGEPEFYFYNKDISITFETQENLLKDNNLNQDINVLPIPYWNYFIEKKILTYGILKKKISIPLLATRGCPYSCFNYCVYPLSQGKKIRALEPKRILKEIMYWKNKYKISSFVFRDPVFSINRKHTIAFCEEIINSNIKIEFCVETHLNNMDDELLNLLVKAGMNMIKVGIESVDSEVLKQSKRKTIETDLQIERIRKIEKLNVKVVTMYIIGMVGDTIDTINNTIEYSIKLNSYLSQFSIFTPYPGTPIFNEYKNILVTTKKENFNQYNLVFSHPNLNNKEARKMLEKAYNSFYLRFSWLKKFFLSSFK